MPIVNLSTERNEMGSVERELRHVRFESDDTAFRTRIQNMDSRLRRDDNHSSEINVDDFDSRSQNTVPRLIRIVVGEPNVNGQIIDRQIFVTEQRYREMTYDEGQRSRGTVNNRSSVSRASGRSNESCGSPLSGRNSNASTTRRTGSLFSWWEDNSSESNSASRNYPNRSHSQDSFFFPKTKRNPEQFLLILKDCLSTSGIHRDLFVPCLSKIFEGPYRSWYLVNKKLWRTWREFARAFRYEGA